MDSHEPLLSNTMDSKETIPETQERNFAAPPSYFTAKNSSFALISFHTLDRIRLTQFPEEKVTRIRECVVANWSAGVSHCQPYDASTEIKVSGFLWNACAASNPKVVKLVQALLAEVHQMGWLLEQEVIICKKAEQKDTLILRRARQESMPTSWFSVSFDQGHVLTIHNAPSDLCQCLIARFNAQEWAAESAYVEDRVEIRMKKPYWMPNGTDTIKTRLMLLEIAEVLDRFEYRIYASLRLGSTNDTLFCMKESRCLIQ